MGSGVKRFTSFSACLVFLLGCSHSVIPVTGFALKNTCRISYDVAICTGNRPKLAVVPQDILTTVKGFDLSSNKISSIRSSDFENFGSLVWLNLKGNGIKKVEKGAFAHLTSLKKLNLNSNKLGNLVAGLFDGLRNLTELRVSRNQIKAVAPGALEALVSLTFLDISKNPVGKHIQPILQLPNLRELVMAGNSMSVFQSGDLTNSSLKLRSLDLSKNPIKIFQITANILPNLTWLNLGDTFRSRDLRWDVGRFLGRVQTLDISKVRLGPGGLTSLLASVNSSLTELRMDQMAGSLAAMINVSCSIPTVSKLQLRNNRLRSINSSVFRLCSGVTELDLLRNQIDGIDEDAFGSLPELMVLTLSTNNLSSVPAATRNLPTLVELDLSKNRIERLRCEDFANLTRLRHLNLYANSISVLPECVFKGLTQLQVLKLQNNSISKISKSFQLLLPNLKRLHLNSNKLVAIMKGQFSGLRGLQNLSLHSNQIKQLSRGSFSGLTNLTTLQLQSNQIEAKVVHGVFDDLVNLRRLDLRNNHIRYYSSDPLPSPPFRQLSLLETLELPSQRRRGKSQLPSNFLEGLSNLLGFNCRNSQLLSLPKGMFTYTPRLQRLDVSSNDFTDLSPDLFHPIPDVRSLYISRISLGSLDFMKEAKLKQLEFLQSRKNMFSVISADVFQSLPGLIYVDLQGNSFTCDCDNAGFLQWTKTNNQTQVFDAYNFECNYPLELKGEKLLELDTRSCTIDTDFRCFICTTCAILLLMAVSFTYHFLWWQLTYAYYFFLALLVDTKYKNRQTSYQYDAFVSYNSHDELWVLRYLLPTLEEEQGWRLCLHHRDFEPGTLLTFNHKSVVAVSCTFAYWPHGGTRVHVDLSLFQVNLL